MSWRAQERARTSPNERALSSVLPPPFRRFFAGTARLAAAVDRLRLALLNDDSPHPLVWFAGSGSGRELFSLVIAASEELGPLAERLRFLGSDPDPTLVAEARRGEYDPRCLRGVSDHIVLRHFRPVGPNRYQVVERHRERVEFHQASLPEMAARIAPESVAVLLVGETGSWPSRGGDASWSQLLAERLVPGGLLMGAGSEPPPAQAWHEKYVERDDGLFAKARSRSTSVPPVPSRERPLSARPGASVSTSPPPPRLSTTQACIASATELGDRGDIGGALALATEALRLEPNGPLGYFVRAQLELAGGSIECALDDLRRLLFLAPSCRLGRYWYIVALRAARMGDRAQAQLTELESQLAQVDDGEVLEDEETTVGALRQRLEALRNEPNPLDVEEG